MSNTNIYKHEETNRDGELVDALLDALDSEKHYIIIGDGSKETCIVAKNVPAEDIMTTLEKFIYKTDQ